MTTRRAGLRQEADDAATNLLADEYALGVLGARRLDQAEALLRSDTRFRVQVDTARRQLAALDEAGPVAVPPASLFQAIQARIVETTKPVTVTAEQGAWHPHSPGIMVKLLHRDAANRQRSMLLRMEAGAVLAAHPHPLAEECLVLEGSVESEGEVLRAGDYQRSAAGKPHSIVTSTTGALLFIRLG